MSLRVIASAIRLSMYLTTAVLINVCVLHGLGLFSTAGRCAELQLPQFDLPRESADKSLKRFNLHRGKGSRPLHLC